MAQKEEKGQVFDLKELMERKILRLSTLKSSTHLSMQRLREEHDKVMNYAKDNGTAETIEEIDKLSQNIEDKM